MLDLIPFNILTTSCVTEQSFVDSTKMGGSSNSLKGRAALQRGPQQTEGMSQQESYEDINNNSRVLQLRAKRLHVFGFSVLKDFPNITRHCPGQPHLTLSLATL